MPNTTNFNWPTPADTDLVKDGAAAIRNLGNGIDTSLIDLKGGTTGQILSKASNADMDFTFITPNVGDITEVQAGVGISVASGTGPIPVITNSSTDLITTAGDLLYGTAADTVARLGIGTAGQVLKVNSGATAPEWGAASSSPTFVGVRCTNGAQTIPNATNTALDWGTETYDTDAFHSTVTNISRFTVPAGKGGYYLILCQVDFQSNSTGVREVIIRKNGATTLQVSSATANGVTARYCNGIFNLVATDYIEIQVYQSSGGNLNTSPGNTGDVNFAMTLLGA